MPVPGICFPRPPLGLWAGGFLRASSGEPWFDASIIERAVGVPGGMRDASHRTPHYGPPGQESLQPKGVSQINLQGGWRGVETQEKDIVRYCCCPNHPRPPPCPLPRPYEADPSTRVRGRNPIEGERKLFQGAYRLLLHLQDRLVGVIETKEATERFAGRLSGELGKPMCASVP